VISALQLEDSLVDLRHRPQMLNVEDRLAVAHGAGREMRDPVGLKVGARLPIDPEMSARSERTTSGSPLYQGVGFRRAARLVLAFLVGSLVVSAVVRGPTGIASLGALAGIVAGVAALWEARVRRIGIRIEPQGILAVYAVGHLRLPLESVAGFSLRTHRSGDGAGRVVIELLDGRRRVVPSASLMGWGPFRSHPGAGTGARPADVVAQLAGQLQRARQQAAAALTGAPPAAL
jgi:hypothetical protein